MHMAKMRTLLSIAALISSSAHAFSPLNSVDHQAAFCRGVLRTALATPVNTENPTLLEALKNANAKLTTADARLAAYLTARIALLDRDKLLEAEQEGSRAQIESAGAVAKCLIGNQDFQSQATLACMERAAGPTDACVYPDFLPQP